MNLFYVLPFSHFKIAINIFFSLFLEFKTVYPYQDFMTSSEHIIDNHNTCYISHLSHQNNV